MKAIFIILTILGGLIFLIFLIRFFTRYSDNSSENPRNNLLEQARRGIGKLMDCCKKLIRK